MNVLCILAVLLLAVTAVPIPEEERISGVNGWYIPQMNGSLVWVSLDEGEKMLEDLYESDGDATYDSANEESESENQEIMARISTSPVKFYLYTNKNPTKGQILKETNKSIKNSDFDPRNPTRFVIHGWIQSSNSNMCKDIRVAWLSRGKYNVIVVDWARARSVEYASSVLAVPKVGKKVAHMVDYLVENHGLNLDETEIIGHSLGAHVAGFTGKNLKSGKLHAIFALDTALPLFSYKKTKKRLHADDAQYVESIHTNGGKLGFLEPIGKAAFYPNGGKSQPGCALDLTGACDHARSWSYYVEAVARDSFPSMRCGDYKSAVKNNCGGSYSTVKMCADTNAFVVSGEYYVPVHSSSPYGFGYGS